MGDIDTGILRTALEGHLRHKSGCAWTAAYGAWQKRVETGEVSFDTPSPPLPHCNCGLQDILRLIDHPSAEPLETT